MKCQAPGMGPGILRAMRKVNKFCLRHQLSIGKFIAMVYDGSIYGLTDDASLIDQCINELTENDFKKYEAYKNEMNELRLCGIL